MKNEFAIAAAYVSKARRESASQCVLFVDTDYTIVWADDGAEGLMGYGIEDNIGSPIVDFLHPDDLDAVITQLAAHIDHSDFMAGETRPKNALMPGVVRARHASGEWIDVEVTLTTRLVENAVSGFIVEVRRANGAAELRRVLDLLARDAGPGEALTAIASLVEAHAEGGCCLVFASTAPGSDGFATDVGAAGELTGPTSELAAAVVTNTTFTIEQIGSTHPTLAAAARSRGFHSLWIAPFQMGVPTEPHGALAVWRTVPAVFGRHGDGVVEGPLHLAVRLATLVVSHDRISNRLIDAASSDPLTGLANRRVFDEVLSHACSERRPFGLLYLDLDDFKLVNDRFGHAVGDQLLIEVGERLRRHVRATDVVVRLGGDEFAIFSPPSTGGEETMEAIGERVCAEVRRPFVIGDRIVAVGASVGAVVSVDGDDPISIAKRADSALYAAKRHHRRECSVA